MQVLLCVVKKTETIEWKVEIKVEMKLKAGPEKISKIGKPLARLVKKKRERTQKIKQTQQKYKGL